MKPIEKELCQAILDDPHAMAEVAGAADDGERASIVVRLGELFGLPVTREAVERFSSLWAMTKSCPTWNWRWWSAARDLSSNRVTGFEAPRATTPGQAARGDDTLQGFSGDDILECGAGDDVAEGGSGDDSIYERRGQ